MKAVVYCRVSSKEQVDGTSLESQKLACEDYAQRNGLSVSFVFVERGESAKYADRTQLLEMMAYCANRENGIDVLLVWKVDRLARNVSDHFAIKAALLKHEVRVVSVTDPETAAGTVELLLQQHRSLLLGAIISEASFRAINVVLLVLLITRHYLLSLPIEIILLAALTTLIWISEGRSISERVYAVEKALGRKSELEYEKAYVAYRFKASSPTGALQVRSFEAVLWFLALLGISVFRMIVHV
jgi:hypothetical protein